jgi:hypothetical protein
MEEIGGNDRVFDAVDVGKAEPPDLEARGKVVGHGGSECRLPIGIRHEIR